MRLAGLQPGDVCQCRKNGVPFYARIVDLDREYMGSRYVAVEPLTPNVSYRLLRSAQILRKVGEREAVGV